jgi:O-antigen ligase
MAGVESPLLTEEFTSTAGDVHGRYSSLYGSALMFGMCGFAQMVSAYRLLVTERRRPYRVVLFALLGIAGLCVTMSYARRAYLATVVAALLAGCVGLLNASGSNRGKRLLLACVLAVSVVGTVVIASESVRRRAFSVLNFDDDDGNVLRAATWVAAVNFVREHPLLGGGPGVLSAVGRSAEDLGAPEDAEVAEMLFLTVLTDLGLVVGSVILLFLVVFSVNRLRGSEDQRLVTAPLIVEGVAGTAVFNPFILMLFLLSMSNARERVNSRRGRRTP